MRNRRWTDRCVRWWPLLAIVGTLALASGIFIGREDQRQDARLEKDLAPLGSPHGPRVLRAERIARVIWGNVCKGDVSLAVARLAGDQAGQASWLIDSDGSFSRCTIIIAPYGPNGKLWPWKRLCQIVVHEYGHLAGQDHVNDPRKVMYPRCTNQNIPRRCMT